APGRLSSLPPPRSRQCLLQNPSFGSKATIPPESAIRHPQIKVAHSSTLYSSHPFPEKQGLTARLRADGRCRMMVASCGLQVGGAGERGRGRLRIKITIKIKIKR